MRSILCHVKILNLNVTDFNLRLSPSTCSAKRVYFEQPTCCIDKCDRGSLRSILDLKIVRRFFLIQIFFYKILDKSWHLSQLRPFFGHINWFILEKFTLWLALFSLDYKNITPYLNFVRGVFKISKNFLSKFQFQKVISAEIFCL